MRVNLAVLTLVLSFGPCGCQSPFALLDGLPLQTLLRPPPMGRTYDKSVLGNLANLEEVEELAVPHSDSFMVELSVGTPPQKLRCLLDTAIADVWLPANPVACGGKKKLKERKFFWRPWRKILEELWRRQRQECMSHRFFNRSKSKSFFAKAPLAVHMRASVEDILRPMEDHERRAHPLYHSEAKEFLRLVTGTIGVDNISMGSGAFHFDNSNQSFLLVNQALFPRYRKWDGVCGIGRQKVALSQEPMWKRFVSKPAGQEEPGGATVALFPGPGRLHYFVVGKVPYKACKEGSLEWAKVESLTTDGVKKNFWLIPGGLAIHRKSPVKSHFLIDTGTSFLLAPPKKYLPFVRSLFAMHTFDTLCGWDRAAGNSVVCDCEILEAANRLLPLRVYIGPRPYEIPIPELFTKVATGKDGQELCLLQIQRNPTTATDPLDLFRDITSHEILRRRDEREAARRTTTPSPPSSTLSPQEAAALIAAQTLADAAAAGDGAASQRPGDLTPQGLADQLPKQQELQGAEDAAAGLADQIPKPQELQGAEDAAAGLADQIPKPQELQGAEDAAAGLADQIPTPQELQGAADKLPKAAAHLPSPRGDAPMEEGLPDKLPKPEDLPKELPFAAAGGALKPAPGLSLPPLGPNVLPHGRRLQEEEEKPAEGVDLEEDLWVMGGVFLERFVVVLDYEEQRVGIAEPNPEVLFPYGQEKFGGPIDEQDSYLELGVLQEQNAELRGMVKQLVRSRDNIADQRKQQEAEKNDLAANVRVLSQQNRELQNRIQTLEYTQEQDQTQFMALKSKEGQMRNQRILVQQDLQDLRRRHGILQQHTDFLKDENSGLQHQEKRMELYLLTSCCFIAFLLAVSGLAAYKVRRSLYLLWTSPEEGKMREVRDVAPLLDPSALSSNCKAGLSDSEAAVE